MQPKWIVIAAALVAALPAALAAQRPVRTPRPPREPRGAFVIADDNRGRIGVVVNTKPDSQTDKIGAKLDDVSPGGPAAQAGLRLGCILPKFTATWRRG